MKNRHKVVLLGDSGVGKTCLILRFVEDRWCKPGAPTIGASFFQKTVKKRSGGKLNLEIWDTAGQEKYDTISKFYVRGSSVCILVFDITREQSLVNVKRWQRKVKDVQKECYIILVGNKTDLKDERVVSREDGEKIKEEIKAVQYVETSCLNGDNIEALMEQVVLHVEKFSSGVKEEVGLPLRIDDIAAERSGCCRS